MHIGFTIRIALPLALACAMANGQTKPNLNGVWKMDPARSEFTGGTTPLDKA